MFLPKYIPYLYSPHKVRLAMMPFLLPVFSNLVTKTIQLGHQDFMGRLSHDKLLEKWMVKRFLQDHFIHVPPIIYWHGSTCYIFQNRAANPHHSSSSIMTCCSKEMSTKMQMLRCYQILTVISCQDAGCLRAKLVPHDSRITSFVGSKTCCGMAFSSSMRSNKICAAWAPFSLIGLCTVVRGGLT